MAPRLAFRSFIKARRGKYVNDASCLKPVATFARRSASMMMIKYRSVGPDPTLPRQDAPPDATEANYHQRGRTTRRITNRTASHNTRGLGIANALAGLDLGIVDFESSIGGLGGCPFAPRAVGNICTEDFVHMAHEMGIETGIDLDALLGVASFAQEVVGRPLPGMVMKAGKASDRHDKAAPKLKVD